MVEARYQDLHTRLVPLQRHAMTALASLQGDDGMVQYDAALGSGQAERHLHSTLALLC